MRSVMSLCLCLAACPAISGACERLNEYDEILATVTEHFFDREFNGLDWEGQVARHRERIACDQTEQETVAVINDLLAELEASHTTLYSRADFHYWGLNAFFTRGFDDYRIDFSGIWPEEIGGRWFARHVLQGSPAEEAGVLPGDELIAIDGAGYRPLTFEARPTVLRVSSDGSTVREVTLSPRRMNLLEAFVEASARSVRTVVLEDKRVGYVQVWTAYPDILETQNDALTAFVSARVDAVVVDYRGGYGGTSDAYLEEIRSIRYLDEVPLYFLIDDSVRSGKEMLSALVRREGLGTLVGSTTSGSFLGAAPFRLVNGKYFLLLATSGSRDGDSYGIEGAGVQPDVPVQPCRRHCSGEDPLIEAVLDLVRH